MFKNVASKVSLFVFDTTTGLPKTGDAANITVYLRKDYGTVTVLADTSATEADATNAKGWYDFDVAQAEANGDSLIFTGKSSTANIVVVGKEIFTTPNFFSSLSINASGLVDILQTAADKVWGTAARTLTAFSFAVDISATGLAAIWDRATSALTTVGSIGKRIVDFLTGDAFIRIGAAGAGLTALGDTRIANLDATITSRSSHTAAQAGTDAASKILGTPTNLLTTDASGRVQVQAGTGTGQIDLTSGQVTVAINNDKTGTRLSSTGIADITRTAMTEAYAADGSTPTMEQMLYMLWASLSEFAISGTTITAKKLDGSTTAMTFALDSSTAPTSRTRAS